MDTILAKVIKETNILRKIIDKQTTQKKKKRRKTKKKKSRNVRTEAQDH